MANRVRSTDVSRRTILSQTAAVPAAALSTAMIPADDAAAAAKPADPRAEDARLFEQIAKARALHENLSNAVFESLVLTEKISKGLAREGRLIAPALEKKLKRDQFRWETDSALNKIVEDVAHTPACTLTGLQAKIGLVKDLFVGSSLPKSPHDSSTDWFKQAEADLDRLKQRYEPAGG